MFISYKGLQPWGGTSGCGNFRNHRRGLQPCSENLPRQDRAIRKISSDDSNWITVQHTPKQYSFKDWAIA